MKQYSTLIVTVGASLIGNIRKISEDLADDYKKGKLDNIKKHMLEGKWGDPETERSYGSEINSTVSLLRNFPKLEEGKFNRVNLFLFVSDTTDGRKIGELLQNFFLKSEELGFSNVKVEVIEDLRDDDENAFGRRGLRNLVKKFAEIARNYVEGIIVNATGGYKAQIAFALALGQAMKFPVYYRFESFNKIIKMPPLPLSLDWDIYVEYNSILEALESDLSEEEKLFEEYGIKNYSNLPEILKSFIEREKDAGKYYVSLNPMGQVFLESARSIIPQQITLKNSTRKPEDKITRNNKESNSNSFDDRFFVTITLSEEPYVERVFINGYGKNCTKSMRKAKLSEGIIKIEFGNSEGLLYLTVETTAKNQRENIAALERVRKTIELI